MKLYAIPGGDWAGTEADYKRKMKAAGHDPKAATRSQIEVPTDKKGLLEFLTFHAVDPLGGRHMGAAGSTTVSSAAAPVDLEALRRQFNPDAAVETPAAPADFPDGRSLAELFTAAPIRVQAELVVGFADRSVKLSEDIGKN